MLGILVIAATSSEEAAKWTQVVVGAIAAILVVVGLSRQWKTARMGKTIDASFHCASRADGLAKMRLEMLKEPSAELRRTYYSRYWAFMSDQFDLWLFGVLDHDTFFDLLCSLANRFIREAKDPSREKIGSIEDAWKGNDLADTSKQISSRGDAEPQPDYTSIEMRRIANPQFTLLINQILRRIEESNKHSGPEDPKESDQKKEHERLRRLAELILDEMERLEVRFARRWRSKVQQGLAFKYFLNEIRGEIQNPPDDYGPSTRRSYRK